MCWQPLSDEKPLKDGSEFIAWCVDPDLRKIPENSPFSIWSNEIDGFDGVCIATWRDSFDDEDGHWPGWWFTRDEAGEERVVNPIFWTPKPNDQEAA